MGDELNELEQALYEDLMFDKLFDEVREEDALDEIERFFNEDGSLDIF